MKIQPDEHVCLIGTTGSGKTELSRFLLANSNRTVVLDPKCEFKLEGFSRGWDLPLFSSDIRRIVKPRRTDDKRMASVVMQCWRRKNVVIYVDELATISEFFEYTEDALTEVMRTGRSRKVTVWTATQRPRNVPKLFMTESRVFIVFSLASADDRHHVAGFIGDEVEDPIPLHAFWYRRPGMMAPALLTYDMQKGTIVQVPPPEPVEDRRYSMREEEAVWTTP